MRRAALALGESLKFIALGPGGNAGVAAGGVGGEDESGDSLGSSGTSGTYAAPFAAGTAMAKRVIGRLLMR